MTSSTLSRPAAMGALLSLAIGSFGIGMTEFVVMGLLPDIASDLLPQLYALDPGQVIVLRGLTFANVVGVPTGTFLGQNLGWHLAFLVAAAIFAVAVVMIALFVPPQPGDPNSSIRHELVSFASVRYGSRPPSGRSGSADSSPCTASLPHSSPMSRISGNGWGLCSRAPG